MIGKRIVLIGETGFSRAVLRHLADAVVAVFGGPVRGDDGDDLRGAVDAEWFDAKDMSPGQINEFSPDAIYCVGYRRILPGPVLDICPVVGFHPTPLPAGRGRCPIYWALDLEWRETAATWFLMDYAVDHGPILAQVPVPIIDGDTPKSLLGRVTDYAVPMISGLSLDSAVEQDHSRATYLPRRTEGNCKWIPFS